MSPPRTPGYVPRAERRLPRRDVGTGRLDIGHDYTPDEVEFFRAVSNFKTNRNCINPTARDVLEIVRQLGYRKDAR